MWGMHTAISIEYLHTSAAQSIEYAENTGTEELKGSTEKVADKREKIKLAMLPRSVRGILAPACC